MTNIRNKIGGITVGSTATKKKMRADYEQFYVYKCQFI